MAETTSSLDVTAAMPRLGFPRLIMANDHGVVAGGAAKVAISEALALAGLGLELDWLSVAGVVDPRLAAEPRIRVTHLDQPEILLDPNRPRAALRGLSNPAAAKALSEILARETGPALVHVHSFSKALTSSVFAAARKAGARVLLTLHDAFLACPNGAFFDYRAGRACTEHPLSSACWRARCDARNMAHKLWRCLRQMIQNPRVTGAGAPAIGFLSPSAATLHLLGPYLPPSAPQWLLPNPVEAPAAGRRVLAEDHAAVICLGRVSAEKGCLVLAEAGRRAGVRVTFVGEGPAGEELRERHPEHRVTGWLAPDKVRSRLERARILAFPSLLHESQPMAPQEALALGVPVLVASGGAAEELVAPGVDGLLAPPGDLDAWTNSLRRLAADHELVKRLSEGAFARFWQDPPTPESHAARLAEIYALWGGREVLGG